MTETKVCTKCGEEKPLTEFHKDLIACDGLQHWCKSCKNECQRGYRERNQMQEAVYSRRYYRCEKNPACPAVGGRGAKFTIFTCEVCGTDFRRLKSAVDHDYARRGSLPQFCSRSCKGVSERKDYKSPYARNIERIKKEVAA